MYLFPVQAYFSYAKCFVFAISPKLSTGTDFQFSKSVKFVKMYHLSLTSPTNKVKFVIGKLICIDTNVFISRSGVL